MKILSIRFENLNSLEGGWEINFTHPAYQENPIFAITGPTGSGKTTLLDAICLALYGRTPRLKIISKSMNEALTRQTGACFSEIIFATLHGTFRCHWSQHRSRKKPQGDLQQPRHEIVNHTTNTIIENTIKNVARVVEEVTGMNFDQFTRSMLLAQGSFAAFLNAPADERAPLLEQITGTEIYSRISQKVYEHTTQQEKTYQLKAEEIKAYAILSAEEEKRLAQNQNDNIKESQAVQLEIEQLNNQIAWQENLIKLRTDITSLKQEKNEIDRELKDKLSQRTKLTRAKQAAFFVPQYEAFKQNREKQHSELVELENVEKKKSELEYSCTSLTQQLHKTSNKYRETEEKLQNERELGKTVRNLDVRLEEYSVNYQKEKQKSDKTDKQISTIKKSIAELHSLLSKKKNEHEECTNYLEVNRADVELVENFALLEEQVLQRHSITTKLDESTERKKQNSIQRKELTKTLAAAADDRAILHKEQKSLTTLYNDKVNALKDIRQRHPNIHEEMENLRLQSSLLDKLETHLSKDQMLSTEDDQRLTEVTELKNTLKKLENQENFQREKIVDQEKIVQKQEEIVFLESRIASYDKERLNLREGSPCPLCGAIEHPFCVTSPDVIDNISSEILTRERETLFKQQSEYHEVKEEIAAISASRVGIERVRISLAEKLADNKKCIRSLLSTGNFTDNFLLPETIEKEKQSLSGQILNLQQTLKNISILEKETETTRKLMDECNDKAAKTDKLFTESEYILRNLVENENELDNQLDNLLQRLRKHDKKLQKSFAVYGITEKISQELTVHLKNLSQRRRKWIDNDERANALRLAITQTEGDFSRNEELFNKLSQDSQEQQEHMLSLKNELSSLANERTRLYGDKNPEIEEKKWSEHLIALAKEKKMYSEKSESCMTDLIRITERLTQLAKATDTRKSSLENEYNAFVNKIKTDGFNTVLDFEHAILPVEEISQIGEILEKLDNRAIKNATLIEEKQQRLEVERQKNLTVDALQLLREKLELKLNKQQEIFQESGRIQGILEENIKKLAQQKEKKFSLITLQQELTRWKKINTLIGSANGKKFRNFAQGITFECVTAHANKNLQKMTDRYILVRDKNHPLDLNIIDNYRAGDIRSTKNLSGGESFLVSLALALGLSNMAGNTIQVDSLFLDEGFGTLDEETLETALQTLSSLQREGKMIGIISHIPMLKDRIDTQIQVIPGRGGHSTLVGPGIQST